MITAIRRQFKGESLKYAMWAILFALAAGYLLPLLIQDSKGRWAIRVNGSEISEMSFAIQAAQEKEFIARIREQYGQYAELVFKSQGIPLDPQERAYEYLVNMELLNQVGRELGIYIGPDFISEKIADPMFIMREQALAGLIPPSVFTQGGGVNREALQSYLRRQGITGPQFEHILEHALMKQVVLDILASTSYVPTFDVMQQYMTENVAKKYSIITVSLNNLISYEKKNVISDADIEQFFNLENTKNKRYWAPEKRSGIIWTFKPNAYGAEPSQEAISAYYEKNKMNMYVDQPVKMQVRSLVIPVKSEADRSTARAQAESLRNELVAHPEQFAKKAELIPLFARGESKKGTAFEQAAFALANQGDISPVITTEAGFELLQLVERKARTFKPLSSVKQEIKNALEQRKFENAFTDDMKRIIRTAESKKAAFEELARAKGASAQKLENVSKDNAGNGQRLFSLKKDGASYFIENGVGYAVLLTDINPAYAPSFASVKADVLQDLYEYRAQKKLVALLDEAKNKKSMSIQELASMVGETVSKTDWLKGTDKQSLEPYATKNMPVQEMLQMEKVGSTLVEGYPFAGFIIRLDDIKPVDQSDFAAKEKALRKKLENERQAQLILGFVASLARTAKIEINETLMQRLP